MAVATGTVTRLRSGRTRRAPVGSPSGAMVSSTWKESKTGDLPTPRHAASAGRWMVIVFTTVTRASAP